MNKKIRPVEISEKMTREEIIKAVTEPKSIFEKKKTVVISRAAKVSFQEAIDELKLDPGSSQYRILQIFCEEKKATTVDVQALVQRMKNMSIEQLKILELISGREDFTIKNILDFVQSIKRIGSERILTLRAFVDLQGVTVGFLSQFFRSTFPQGERKVIGKEAYDQEVREKVITPDQVNVFYNICNRVESITPKTAIALLSKTRRLKKQHAQLINTLLKEDPSFGQQPINNDNVLGFMTLWLSLPEMKDREKFQRLTKKLSRSSDKKKKDFQHIIQSYRKEIEKEKATKKMLSRIRNFSFTR